MEFPENVVTYLKDLKEKIIEEPNEAKREELMTYFVACFQNEFNKIGYELPVIEFPNIELRRYSKKIKIKIK